MRKTICVLAFICMFVMLSSQAAASSVDYSQMTNAELLAMDDELADEMISRGLYAYISPSGKKYHTKPTCSSMKSTMRVPVDDLEACGYEPCKRCYKKKEGNNK